MIKFWRKHLNWFIPFVSELYPLTKFQLLHYEEILDWDRIKSNPFIKWDEKTLSIFQERLNKADRIKPSPLDRYYDKPAIPKYPLADAIYFRDNEESKGKIFWKDIKFGIGDIGLAGEDDIVMKLKWHFNGSMALNYRMFQERPLSTEYIEKRVDTTEWKLLSRYFGLEWSFELLQRFEDYWDTEQLICNHTAFNYCLKDDLDDEFIENVLR